MVRSGGRLRYAAMPVLVVLLATVAGQPAGATPSHELIAGSGSSWAENGVNQWIADQAGLGLKVVYTGSGSAAGRKDFADGVSDFGVTDVPYGADPTDPTDRSNRSYAYVPILAGGTAFPYNLTVDGARVTTLRLSGQTLAEIFTNQITNWADPAITADNNGHALPSLPITPVVPAEGSGATYAFTQYLATEFPAIWSGFSQTTQPTEYFPSAGNQLTENGSDGVMNYVTSAAGNGSIAFDEYSYALAKNWPVAKVGNAAGYFTAPTSYNVAVALTQAEIDTTDVGSPARYLTADLSRVYSNTDPRTYPLSSYSYEIIPTGSTDDPTMTTAKRQTLADFTTYAECAGQAEVGAIGYSPLPINLVQAGMDQIAKLKVADPGVDLSSSIIASCHNPTFDPANPGVNLLTEIAPQPLACDKAGAGPCGVTTGTPIVTAPVTTGTTAPAATATKIGTTVATGGGSATITVATTIQTTHCKVPTTSTKKSLVAEGAVLTAAHCGVAHDLDTPKGYPKAPRHKRFAVTGFAIEHISKVHNNGKLVTVRTFKRVSHGTVLPAGTVLALIVGLVPA